MSARLTMHQVGRRWECRLAYPCPCGLQIDFRSAVDYIIDGTCYHVSNSWRAGSPEKARAKAERFLARRARRDAKIQARQAVINAEYQRDIQ